MYVIVHTFMASHACEKLPRSAEDLLHDVYTTNFAIVQNISQNSEFSLKLNFIHCYVPAKICWLSLHSCVSRLIEQWDALLQYFKWLFNAAKTCLLLKNFIFDSTSNMEAVLFFRFCAALIQRIEFDVSKCKSFYALPSCKFCGNILRVSKLLNEGVLLETYST